ncbi:hypothetical protein BTO05_08025 [Winogradskyella sp. PC-19]|uniref:thioredoxin family protein n=1 Tax=unclassified Winogradskyella TaxID=2615021 RepID=UPI000B3C2842|nr:MULTISPECIES: thioredoxin fold domain-containing protein [unclassified Winogradskyella]ARV09588.1 hypothetical protein BTO05_08025 [Winogradskyella sp. PC-19]RZN83443.1 MAG: DUF255 domain-containing protein [Winogradskyella sp.]
MKQLIFVLVFSFFAFGFAQNQSINWLSFEELEIALSKAPKKVMIHFYADWCSYCKKMERKVYTKPEIITKLNSDYYVVKFNVETKNDVHFGGKTFKNLQAGKKRRPNHELAELLAKKDGKQVTLPAVIFLDEELNIEKRVFSYIAPKELLSILKEQL